MATGVGTDADADADADTNVDANTDADIDANRQVVETVVSQTDLKFHAAAKEMLNMMGCKTGGYVASRRDAQRIC